MLQIATKLLGKKMGKEAAPEGRLWWQQEGWKLKENQLSIMCFL